MDKPFILIADDEEVIRELLANVIADQGYIFDMASNGTEALEHVARTHYDIVFTDLQMPGASGLDVLKAVKDKSPATEVVILTGYSSEEAAIRAIRLGAFDYLKKPLNDIDLIPRIIFEIQKKRTKSLEKQKTLQQLKAKAETLTAKKTELEEIAITDPLTGLYNRRYFSEQLREQLQKAKMFGGHFSLILVDLDDFKRINDSYGHPAGDVVLSETAVILKTSVRSGDIVCRYGGDEFLLMLKNTDPETAFHVAKRIQSSLEDHKFRYMDQELQCTASIGVSTFPDDGLAQEEEMLENVDKAMYEGKKNGKNRIEVYSPS